MTIPNSYIEKIRAVYPQLSLDSLEFNQDGLNNDVVIVNQQLVCRFPKTDWAKADLHHEVKILEVARSAIDLPIPKLDHVEADFVSYPLIRGEPLSRNQLLRLDPLIQEKVIEQLGQFLQQLHGVSERILKSAQIPHSPAEQSQEDILNLYEQVQQILFPHFWKHQRIWVHEHFEPLISGTLSLDASPVLVHGNLGCYHILFDAEQQTISGVIDFGTAGLGNPVIDFAALLDTHGEPLLKRLAKSYPTVEPLLDQARFRAGNVWLQWALMGIQHQDTGLLLAHLGSSARDILPMGSTYGTTCLDPSL